MPGPILTVTVSETARRGFWAGPMIVFGHAVLEFGLLLALVLGLGPILQRDLVGGIIGLVGAAILFFLATGMFRSLPKVELDLTAKKTGGVHPFLSGILLSLANPYWTLWWATVGLSYLVISQRLGWAGVLAFFFGHIMSDLVWFSFVSGLVHGGRNFLGKRVYQGLVLICALFLTGFAVYFGINGVRLLGG